MDKKIKILKVYISLLRGINIAGQKIIKMIDLKTLYESLEFENVTTYIQSGNVVFSTKESDVGKIADKISKAIVKKFNFNVPVLIKTIEEFEKIVKNNPFDQNLYMKQLSIVYLFKEPKNISYNQINSFKKDSEKIVFKKNVLYCLYLEGQAKTKLTVKMFEKKLCTVATARNLRTSTRLLELAKAIYKASV